MRGQPNQGVLELRPAKFIGGTPIPDYRIPETYRTYLEMEGGGVQYEGIICRMCALVISGADKPLLWGGLQAVRDHMDLHDLEELKACTTSRDDVIDRPWRTV